MDIEFICSDKSVLKHFPIVPAKDCLPQWYKELHAQDNNGVPTVAGCMPVRDMVTSGYIVPNAFEQEVISDSLNQYGEEEIERVYPVEEIGKFFEIQNHMTHPGSGHSHSQCPVEIEGSKKSYFKISLPWQIKTPPGYSCLIQQPYFFFEDRFTLFPGIVDTDTIDVPWVNWPGVMNGKPGDKVTIEPGAPLMQIIPFKRDEWQMEVEVDERGAERDTALKFFLTNAYARIFHRKKKYK